MRFVIWGAGVRGRELAANMYYDEVSAFIDLDPSKQGKYLLEKPIVGIEEYLNSYRDNYIIISTKQSDEIISYLRSNKMYRYFDLEVYPPELRWGGSGFSWREWDVSLNRDEVYAVYGTDLFGILFYKWMMRLGYKNGYLISHVDAEIELINCLKKDFPSYKIVHNESLVGVNSYHKIFVTVPKEKRSISICESVIDVYDLTKEIPWYHNKRIEKFKDINWGKRCFIIGSGPSLRMEDLQRLYEKKEFSMGTNNIFAAFDETEWRPTYYLAADPMMFQYYSQEIIEIEADAKFLGDLYFPFWRDNILPENVYKYHVHRLPGFSKDFSICSYDESTVTMDCIQLATYMGFKEIYLLGIDFDYSSRPDKITAYFSEKCKEKLEKNGVITAQNVQKSFTRESSLKAYNMAKEFAKLNNIRIYNATRGGALEVFERVEFDSLF